MISLLLIYRLLFAHKRRMNIKQLEVPVDKLVVACVGNQCHSERILEYNHIHTGNIVLMNS